MCVSVLFHLLHDVVQKCALCCQAASQAKHLHTAQAPCMTNCQLDSEGNDAAGALNNASCLALHNSSQDWCREERENFAKPSIGDLEVHVAKAESTLHQACSCLQVSHRKMPAIASACTKASQFQAVNNLEGYAQQQSLT